MPATASNTGPSRPQSGVSRSLAKSSAVSIGVSRGPSPLSNPTVWPSASGITRMSENRIAASKPNRRIGCKVASMASLGV